MQENIKLKFEYMKGSIEIELPPNPQLLKDTLKLLHKYNDAKLPEDLMEYKHDEKSIPEELSKELLQKKEFSALFRKLCSDYGGRSYRYTRIPNITKIEDDQVTQSIDQKELKKACDTAFDGLNKRNVKLMIIHIASNIQENEKDMIIEKITQGIQMMTVIKFKSNTNNKHTLIETIYFGIEIENTPDFMRFFG